MLEKELFQNISTKKILKFLNENILELGYDENSYVKSETTIPIMIKYKGEKKELGFKIIKDIVREYLQSMRYTSKIFRDLVDELHRAVLALEKYDLTVENITKLIPSALRNVIGANPFSRERCQDDYMRVLKLKKSIDVTWIALPTEERMYILKTFFEAGYRVILLSYEFLPGHVLNSTLIQMNNLITYLTSKGELDSLSDSEMNKLNENVIQMNALIKSPDRSDLLDISNWSEQIENIYTICNGLMSSNSIKWIVGRDKHGRDIFTFSSKKYQEEGGKSTLLISSAIYGIEAQISEITNSTVQQLDQGDNAILISKRELFSILSLVEKPVTHLIRQKLQLLADFVERNYSEKIKLFKGNISIFQDGLLPFLKKEMFMIFELD